MSSVCPFVCPPVKLVDCDHTGCKFWKLIARTISPTPSLFVAQRPSTYSQGTCENFGETENLTKKTLLSLSLVRLCEETWERLIYRAHRAVIFAIAQLSCLTQHRAKAANSAKIKVIISLKPQIHQQIKLFFLTMTSKNVEKIIIHLVAREIKL